LVILTNASRRIASPAGISAITIGMTKLSIIRTAERLAQEIGSLVGCRGSISRDRGCVPPPLEGH
jgi:hypothetical protein